MSDSELDSRTGRPGDQGPDEILYSSGPELYDHIFKTRNRTAKQFIRFEYDSNLGFVSHKNLTVLARNENEVVALGSGYDGKQYWAYVFGTIYNVLRFYGLLECWKVFRRMLDLKSVMKQPRSDELYFSNAGVSPEYRNTGVATRVLLYKIQEAREKGYRQITLEVAHNNPLKDFIISVLEKFGFEFVQDKKFTGKSTMVPNVTEMALKLK